MKLDRCIEINRDPPLVERAGTHLCPDVPVHRETVVFICVSRIEGKHRCH